MRIEKCVSRRAGRPVAGAVAGALVLAVAGGCAAPSASPPPRRSPPPAPRVSAAAFGEPLSPLELGRLRQRALDFIGRAARSEIDIVACNALEALVELDPDGGAQHFRAALGSESALVRWAGCLAVGDTRDKDAMDRIVRCLNDPDPRVRLGAAFAAYRCGESSYGWTLVETLRGSKDGNLRRDAALLIGRLRESGARRVLRAIADDRSTEALLAVQVIGALALIGDARAVEELGQFAQGSPPVRAVALQAMVELASPATRDALLYRLQLPENDEYLENRLIAARALGRLGNKQGFDLAVGCLLNPPKASADDPNAPMRVLTTAALALGDIRDIRAVNPLRQLAESSNDPRVQVAACAAICRIIEAPVALRKSPAPPDRAPGAKSP